MINPKTLFLFIRALHSGEGRCWHLETDPIATTQPATVTHQRGRESFKVLDLELGDLGFRGLGLCAFAKMQYTPQSPLSSLMHSRGLSPALCIPRLLEMRPATRPTVLGVFGVWHGCRLRKWRPMPLTGIQHPISSPQTHSDPIISSPTLSRRLLTVFYAL